ncbi:serine hydrolase [Citreicella sp. C3M06]|uniref:serine hydrolase domain-containing protein n=1 Tax=Citreicella sp. C3M06 TaxID=2841564 RepID=UPI001C083CEE|nr:serine hydrolase [Citreicella sp. C3M06]MBU2963312.1 serine hydrolase [Citreicella sp. C3M06]
MDRRIFLTALAAPFLAPRALAAQEATLSRALDSEDQLHSIQVMRGNDLLLAEAPRGQGLDALANIKSCSKSIVALLLGQALARGDVPALSATLAEVAPSLIPAAAKPEVPGITLKDLVTLRTGLERTSGAEYGGWVASGNWVADALSRPMVARPGGRMLYSTGSTHVLGAALSVASGDSLLRLARDGLGAPLGIEIPAWTRDPQGYYLGGNEMALTPRAMLRIAQMMRDGGVWGGRQVVSPDWVAASMTARTQSPYSGMHYGYGWFLTASGYALARGYGGQIIAFHQGKRLAVAITSDPTRPARSEGYFGTLKALLEGPILALA